MIRLTMSPFLRLSTPQCNAKDNELHFERTITYAPYRIARVNLFQLHALMSMNACPKGRRHVGAAAKNYLGIVPLDSNCL